MKIDPKDLPPMAQDIAERIGLDAALTLIAKKGGCYLKVPLKARQDGPISKLIGYKAARDLSFHFGGEKLELPRAAAAIKKASRADVFRAIAEGKISKNKAAKILELSVRHVRELANRHGRDTRQHDLFNGDD